MGALQLEGPHQVTAGSSRILDVAAGHLSVPGGGLELGNAVLDATRQHVEVRRRFVVAGDPEAKLVAITEDRHYGADGRRDRNVGDHLHQPPAYAIERLPRARY